MPPATRRHPHRPPAAAAAAARVPTSAPRRSTSAQRARGSGSGMYRPTVAAWTKQTLQDHFFKEAKARPAPAPRAHMHAGLCQWRLPACARGMWAWHVGLSREPQRPAAAAAGGPIGTPRSPADRGFSPLPLPPPAACSPCVLLRTAEAGLRFQGRFQAAGNSKEAQSHPARWAGILWGIRGQGLPEIGVPRPPPRSAPPKFGPQTALKPALNPETAPKPAPQTAGGRVLDLGCVPGAWLQVACQQLGPRERGGLVLGIDIQEAKVGGR